jgi:high-affinity K+ transport system ATPase subunit B
VETACPASLADETPEGRSIVTLAQQRFQIQEQTRSTFMPFSAKTRMSGADIEGRSIRKGAVDALRPKQRHMTPANKLTRWLSVLMRLCSFK